MHLLESLDHQLLIGEDLYFRWCAECLAIYRRFHQNVIGFTFGASMVVYADTLQACDPPLVMPKEYLQTVDPHVLSRFPEISTQGSLGTDPQLRTMGMTLDPWLLSLPSSPVELRIRSHPWKTSLCKSTLQYVRQMMVTIAFRPLDMEMPWNHSYHTTLIS